MPKTPKSVTVIIGLVVAGLQALVELYKVATKEASKEAKPEDKKGEE